MAYEENGAEAEAEGWGYELQLDLRGCDHALISDGDFIAGWVADLCQLIGMTPYGSPLLVRFGKDPKVSGYSLCQFIEESNISGHFIEGVDAAAINIFSCKPFDVGAAKAFTARSFGAIEAKSTWTVRLPRRTGNEQA